MATYRAFLNLYNENDEKNTYLPYTDMDAVYSQNGYDDLIGTSHNIVKSSSPLTLRNALKVINKAVYDLKDGAFLPKVTTTTPYPGDSAVVTPNMVYQVQQDLNNEINELRNKINNNTSSSTIISEVYDLLVPLLYSNSTLKGNLNSQYVECVEDISADDNYDMILGQNPNGPGISYDNLHDVYKGKVLTAEVKLNISDHHAILYYSLNLTLRGNRFGSQKLRFLFGLDNGKMIFDEQYFIDEYDMINTFYHNTYVGNNYTTVISFNVGGKLTQFSSYSVYLYTKCIFEQA